MSPLRKTNSFHKTTSVIVLHLSLLKDEEKRSYGDKTRRGSYPLFMDGYNIFCGVLPVFSRISC